MVTGPHRRAPLLPGRHPATRCGHDGGVFDAEVRALRKHEYRAGAAVTCRALADSPTAIAIYGDDPLQGLAGLYGELGPFFDQLPAPQMAAFAGDCVIATAGMAPPGGCIGAFMTGDATEDLLRTPAAAVGDPARAQVFWAHWALADLAE